MRASRSTRVSGGIVGVQFLTAAAPGSPPAEALSAIHRALGGGSEPRPGEAALFFADADGGSTGGGAQVVGLWVPIDQRADAESRLRSAGFDLS
jgi:hypothetical protein